MAHCALLLAALAVSDCRYSRTQVVLWVWSDLPATGPDSLSALQIVATHGDANYQIGPVPVTTGTGADAGMNVRVLYPSGNSVVTLYPDDNNAPYEFTIQVTPVHDDGNGALRSLFAYGGYRQTSSFTPGQTTQIDIYLTVACEHIDCGPNATCGLNGCQSIDQRTNSFDGSFPAPPDVPTFDASYPRDAATDSGSMDARIDAHPDAPQDVVMCNAGFTDCGGTCVDLQNDTANCGACGAACATNHSCSGGACSQCTTSQTDCSGSCVNLRTNDNNCGSCGNSCPTGYSCSSGRCHCVSDGTCNGSVCQTTDNCGTVCHCSSGLYCVTGSCCVNPSGNPC